ncbi:MAG TPA: YjbQ family protein [Clostridiales bacterium]|nr:YjbQ family protein [Clostridiales bacterium]
MIYEYTLKTPAEAMVSITRQVKDALEKSGVAEGLCIVYCPHTTAGITINENSDPDVVRDMLLGLARAFPHLPEYRHSEGNSTAHIKASVVGSSVTVPVENGRMLLGTWQDIYFCEFDGPRTRTFYVKIIKC